MTGALGPHLSLWKQALGVVPDEVWDRKDLQTVVLADNDLVEVSDRIGNLRNLRMLDLGHNRLRCLPDSIGDIEGLSDFLYLHDNQLTELPASLMRLNRLLPEHQPQCVRGAARGRDRDVRPDRVARDGQSPDLPSGLDLAIEPLARAART